MVADEIDRYRAESTETLTGHDMERARALFEEVTMREDFPEFMTIPGYVRLCPPAVLDTGVDQSISVRATTLALTCSSGMFTQLQLKPRVVFSFAFMGWS